MGASDAHNSGLGAAADRSGSERRASGLRVASSSCRTTSARHGGSSRGTWPWSDVCQRADIISRQTCWACGSRRRRGATRLMWCTRLPFGYLDSPRLFCSVTEALAAEFRRRVAGMGIYCIVFVDDWLVIGDDEAATGRGARGAPDRVRRRVGAAQAAWPMLGDRVLGHATTPSSSWRSSWS